MIVLLFFLLLTSVSPPSVVHMQTVGFIDGATSVRKNDSTQITVVCKEFPPSNVELLMEMENGKWQLALVFPATTETHLKLKKLANNYVSETLRP